MSSSAINAQLFQAKIGSIQNQADSSSVYSAGVWSFKNSTALTSVTITDAGNVGIGTASPIGTAAGRGNLTINGTSSAILSLGVAGSSRGFIFADATHTELDSPGYQQFNTNGAERMRIDASGNLLVGTTSAPTAGKMRVSAASSSAIMQIERTGTSAGSGFIGADNGSCFMAFDSSVNLRFYVTPTGNYWFQGSNVSDERLKEDIQDVESQLQNVLALSPKTFRFKGQPQEDGSTGEPGRVQHGFIAQEVKAVIPKLVTGAETNPDEYMGVDYLGLTSILVKAIQEQQTQIEALKAEVAALKAP